VPIPSTELLSVRYLVDDVESADDFHTTRLGLASATTPPRLHRSSYGGRYGCGYPVQWKTERP
jgi:hypothetical protein